MTVKRLEGERTNLHRLACLQRRVRRDREHDLPSLVQLPLQLVLTEIFVLKQRSAY